MTAANSRTEASLQAARSAEGALNPSARQPSNRHQRATLTDVQFLKTVFAELTGSGSQRPRRLRNNLSRNSTRWTTMTAERSS